MNCDRSRKYGNGTVKGLMVTKECLVHPKEASGTLFAGNKKRIVI